MTIKNKPTSSKFQLIGQLPTGTPSALAIAWDEETIFFQGAEVGLSRSAGFEPGASANWQRLSGAPLGILCLDVSPNFAQDHTLVVGTNKGIFISTDRGETWHPGSTSITTPVPLCVSFSPDYARDGIILAGTLEDGILFSNSRGARWELRSFGLIDLSVLALAFSPDFDRDGIIFAGTNTAVYFSYNQARAWKELPFPEDEAAILSLLCSPDFSTHPMVLAGTENNGLYRSTDLGASWQRSDLPAVCINALRLSPSGKRLFAATDEGLFASQDNGINWENLLPIQNTISLAVQDDLILVGAVDQGVMFRFQQQDWAALPSANRAVVGMSLSDHFHQDGIGFLFGLEEGIWKTIDGGKTWGHLTESSVEKGIFSLVVSPDFAQVPVLAVGAQSGLLISRNGGESFQVSYPAECERVTFSPNGKILACHLAGGGIQVSSDGGKSWRQAPGVWDDEGKVLGLAVDNMKQLYIAFLERTGELVSLWQGRPGETQKVLSQPVPREPPISFWLPAEPAAERPGFVGLGSSVWKFNGRKGAAPGEIALLASGADREVVLSLTGTQTEAGIVMFASTGKRLYQCKDGKSSQVVYDFAQERAIVLSLSKNYPQDRTLYALFLGGGFYQGSV